MKMENEMSTQVLVTYATKYGATAEIAEKIGQTLRQAGFHTDVLPADQVNDLSSYQAVVVGSAVYVGKWRKEAVAFLEDNEQALAERPVWLFSSGPTGEGDAEELLKGWRLPEAQQALVERIHPRNIAVFHGELNGQKLNLLEKWVIKNVKAPLGDFRDWDSITSWATEIAAALQEAWMVPA